MNATQPQMGTVRASASRAETAGAEYAPRSAVEAYGRDGAFAPGRAAEAGAQQQSASRDGFLTKFSPTGTLVYSTYVGGGDIDTIFAVAVDNRGNAYCTGLTASANFPVKNPAQATLRGLTDAFVIKLADQGDTQKTVSAASYEGATLAPDQIVSSFGTGLATGTQTATALPLPTHLLDSEVRVEDSQGVTRLAQLFFISPTQINFSVPSATAEGAARITVWNNGAIISSEAVQIARVAPGLFSANASGKDVLAGVLLRVKSDGRQLYEPVARYDVILNRYVPLPIAFGGDQLYLLAFGTGLRYRGGLPTVNANIGGVSTEVTFAGAQGSLVGLDQVNIALPNALQGRGTVNLNMIVDGKNANITTMNFQ
jgi:uncharacterized protein (TIGR03437 family)